MPAFQHSGGERVGKETECKQEAGRFRPEIDRNRCEGKQECVAVCPYDVFTMGTLQKDARAGLTPLDEEIGRELGLVSG